MSKYNVDDPSENDFRMRLDPSDAQVQRHSMGQMADAVAILKSELERVGLEGKLRDQLVVDWWRTLISSAMQPDYAEILKSLKFPTDEED